MQGKNGEIQQTKSSEMKELTRRKIENSCEFKNMLRQKHPWEGVNQEHSGLYIHVKHKPKQKT